MRQDTKALILLRPALFLAYFAGAMLAGGLLADPLHELLSLFGDPRYYKLVHRCGLLVALLALPWLLRRLQLNSPAALGFAQPRALFLRGLTLGWLAGCLILAGLASLEMLLQLRIVDPLVEAGGLPLILLRGLLAGLAVGFIEELFFRGVVLEGVRRTAGWTWAVLFSSAFYALVHFLRTPALHVPDPGPMDGISLALGMLGGLTQVAFWWQDFISLMLLGILLCLLRRLTGSLAWSIGLHAGAVAAIKVFKHYTDGGAEVPLKTILIGNYDGIIGNLASLWLGLLIVALLWWERARSRPGAGPPSVQ